MNRNTRVLLGVAAAGVVVTAFSVPYASGALYIPPPPLPAPPTIEDATPKLITDRLPIGNGDTLDQILARAGVDSNTRFEMLSAFNKAYSVRRVQPGRDLLMTRRADTDQVDSLKYIADADSEVVLHRFGGVSEAELVEIPGTIRAVPVCATLQGSLFETVDRAGEDPQLALLVADIFSFDIDFYRDPQPGDEFCILVEKKFYDNGQPSTYKRVLAAQYNNAGTKYDAYRFAGNGGSGDFFTSDGRALKSAFLRSPLAFDARVSSHFSRARLHPVLHTTRPHLGTDYAAPTGTPVRAVASGRVAISGYTAGNGNYVVLDHANGYRTMYLHFSKRLVRAGQRVDQGQTIGLVGSTGLASGPHVDIRISKNGKFMDWEKTRAPRTMTLSAQQKESFGLERDRLKALMQAARKSPQVASNRTGDAGF
jgi:murein DD-endopeptidase MepM/ murein hydrolase activator NlpD